MKTRVSGTDGWIRQALSAVGAFHLEEARRECVSNLVVKRFSQKGHGFSALPFQTHMIERKIKLPYKLGDPFPALQEFTVSPQKNPFTSLSSGFSEG